MVDREHLARVARNGPEPIFATVSGAHLYGFASADSDVDLRGAFMLSAAQLLGLRPPAKTLSVEDKTRIDLDWVAHGIRKFARLMTNHNGYVLEQLFSPLVVTTTPAHAELIDLGKGCLTRPTVRHYMGFARGRREALVPRGLEVLTENPELIDAADLERALREWATRRRTTRSTRPRASATRISRTSRWGPSSGLWRSSGRPRPRGTTRPRRSRVFRRST